MSKPLICLIVARALNGVIGYRNQLPWKLSNDLKFFKQRTLGRPIIMGRKTFESIGRPLPGRQNIVVTRSESWRADGVIVARSLGEALDKASDAIGTDATSTPEIMVIGGAEIYRQALPLANRLEVTEVQAEPEGDAFFPEPDLQEWEEISRETNLADEKNDYAHHFVTYQRRLYAS